VEKGAQHLVHQSLEGCWGVRESKRHKKELEQTFMGTKRRLVVVVEVHPHLVVLGAKVKLGEEGCLVQLVQQFFHHLNGKFILDGVVVQCSIIDTEMP
jgi:hypothetical protein